MPAQPEAIPATQLLPQNLPPAWKDGESTALAMAVALSQLRGKNVPWWTVKQAIDGAFRARPGSSALNELDQYPAGALRMDESHHFLVGIAVRLRIDQLDPLCLKSIEFRLDVIHF